MPLQPGSGAHGGQLSFTPSKAARFIEALRGGNYQVTALAYSGIAESTYRSWMRLAERENAAATLRGENPDHQLDTYLENHPTDGSYPNNWEGWTGQAPGGYPQHLWPAVVFAAVTRKAEAEAEVRALAQVQIAARSPQHWQAAMTFLERRYPDRYARPAQRVDVGGAPDGSPIRVANIPSSDEIAARIAALAAAAAASDARGVLDAGELEVLGDE